MADIDCNSEMRNFHRDEVTLSQTQQGEMRSRRNAGRTRLESGLNLKGHPQPREVHSQGSYQMRTMTQDNKNDYDIDDGVYFESGSLTKDGEPLTPLAARERVCDALKWDGRLKKEATVKRNCVRQEYPEGFHIDMPVYRVVSTKEADGKTVEHFELASGDEWVESDARGVTRWYNGLVGELNAGESDGSQMRRVTKLTKKFARRNDWKLKTTSGICITKLVVDHFVHVEDREDKALRETWKAIEAAFERSTQIDHPVLEGTRLAEPEDEAIKFFRGCLTEALAELEQLDSAECTRKDVREVWDSTFDTSFFADEPDDDGDDGGGKKSEGSAFIVTSTDTARRNDGGGRFG
jgi:hypothetical protein